MDTDKMLEGVNKLKEAMTILNGGPLEHTLACLLQARRLLLEQYAPFKVGDRVQLNHTPTIDEKHAWGWLSSKHFLKKGACGVVRESDVHSDGALVYHVEFDDESWKDRDGNVHYRADGERHQFCLRVSELEAETPNAELSGPGRR